MKFGIAVAIAWILGFLLIGLTMLHYVVFLRCLLQPLKVNIMSVVLKTERKSLKSILLYILLYLILSIGGLTMIYPFLLMFSGFFSSKIDANEFKIIPSFLVNEEVLYQKYISSKYNENFQDYLTINNNSALNFSSIQSPSEFKEELINDWILFHNSTAIPTSWYLSGFNILTRDGKIIQENERAFRKYIQKICENNISIYRERYNESIESWFFLKFQPERLSTDQSTN